MHIIGYYKVSLVVPIIQNITYALSIIHIAKHNVSVCFGYIYQVKPVTYFSYDSYLILISLISLAKNTFN